jgi:hypothetical protein
VGGSKRLALIALAGCASPPGSVTALDAAPADTAPPDQPDAQPIGLPDLVLNPRRLRVELSIGEETFASDACELMPVDDCVLGSGPRRLLRFAVETVNIGLRDLEVGVPGPDNPDFVRSECHDHWHFAGYTDFSLEDGDGNVVAPGHKQAFCLLDTHRFDREDPSISLQPRFHCLNMGIQRGWSDVYAADLPCQWIDITGVADGDYVLRVRLNPKRRIGEADFENNDLAIPVQLGDPDLLTPTEPCPADIDPISGDGPHRECGWQLAGIFACEAGRPYELGCAASCGLGQCTGDPVMRVCDSSQPDGNCASRVALATSNNECLGPCPRVRGEACPDSGSIDVYVAPARIGAPFTCDLAFAYLDSQ